MSTGVRVHLASISASTAASSAGRENMGHCPVLLIAVLMTVLVWRILDEEKLLRNELPGYAEYTQRVRYRLVPFVW